MNPISQFAIIYLYLLVNYNGFHYTMKNPLVQGLYNAIFVINNNAFSGLQVFTVLDAKFLSPLRG